MLYTGTRLYLNTGLVILISERFFHYCPFDIHFEIFSVRNTLKSTSFAVNNVNNFCFVLKWTLPLFCAGERLSQCMRIQEDSS